MSLGGIESCMVFNKLATKAKTLTSIIFGISGLNYFLWKRTEKNPLFSYLRPISIC